MLSKQGAGLFMKSRTKRFGNVESRIEWSGKQTLHLASTIAIATALSFIVQPLASPVFAKGFLPTGKSTVQKSVQLAESNSDSEESDDDDKKSEPAKKSKKEIEKADKKAKEAAKDAAEEKTDKKAKAKKEDKEEKAAKKVDDKKADKEAKKADDKKVEKEAKKVDDKKVEKEAKKVDEKKADKEAKAKPEADDKKADKKKKKGGWFGRGGDDEEVVVEEVIEVTPEKKPATSPATTVVTPAAKAAPVEATASSPSDKPLLLPDLALVSVLQDISKSLGDVPAESGVETADEKVIVGLARQLLDKALGSGQFKDNRILAPEHNNSAKNSMTTEAWASGDVIISDKLRGSVATVWGKRINGSLHVTIAGECTDKTLSNGEKVGEFIVYIRGKSPVKSGFDIQSQSDVTYWIGSLNSVAVEAACSRLKEKPADGEGEGEAAPAAKPETKGEVKKKSTVILEAILTKRGMEYLVALAKYQDQQQLLIAQQHAEAALADREESTTDDTTSSKASGDEVKPKKVARDVEVDENEDDERVAKRPRSSDDDEEDVRVTKRPRKTDEDSDEERVVRRPKADDDEKDDENKVARRPRDNDDDEKPRSKNDEKQDSERPARRDKDVEKTASKLSSGDDDDDFSVKRKPTKPVDEPNVVAKAPEKTPEKPPEKTPEVERPATPKDEPSWRDDWSRDGGNNEPPKLTTNQTSKLPVNNQTASITSAQPILTPTNKEVTLTRISMASPAPASAASFSRAWESPAVNAAPHSPSLDASLLAPERAIAGQFLTVSVIAKDRQPEGAIELSFNGATLSTDPRGQVMYMIPEDQPPGHTLHIAISDRPELNPRVVDILQPLDDTIGSKAPRIDRVSQMVAADGVLVIDGHDFEGLAERNRIVVDNEHDCKVIAASPVQLRVTMPAKITPGTHNVTLNNNALRSTPAKFDFVKAEIAQEDLRKTKGVLNRIVVRVQGTKNPVPVRVVNKTPDVIKVTKGDNLLVTTSGGADNSYILSVKQLKKGDYKVETSIEI